MTEEVHETDHTRYVFKKQTSSLGVYAWQSLGGSRHALSVQRQSCADNRVAEPPNQGGIEGTLGEISWRLISFDNRVIVTILIGLCTCMTPPNVIQIMNLIKFGVLWAWTTIWGYGKEVHAKFWPRGTPWDPSYDHFCLYVQRAKS